jgi:uncharacterized membrane protein
MFSWKHSLAKTLSWRGLATLITAGVAWVITGEVYLALAVGVMDTVIKAGVYYAHERLWNRIPIGQTTQPKDRI